MSKQTINIGASPNDGTGTPLRTSFDYTNQNFTELYTALGGGVGLPGATTQVIFNDGGTNLAGDSGLTFNKTTDTLSTARITASGDAIVCSSTGDFYVGTTVSPQFKVERATGNASITGDLTVDTSTLKVDSTNNRVGILNASPNDTLTISSDNYLSFQTGSTSQNSGRAARIGAISVGSGNGYLVFETYQGGSGGGERYRIASDGVSTWSVAGTTAMTLDAAGNIGLGILPSSGGSIYYKSLELGKAGCGLFVGSASLSGSELTYLSGNAVLAYNSGNEWKYGNNGSAAALAIEDGVFTFKQVGSGTAGNIITTWTDSMALDASGNLLVGTTSTLAAWATKLVLSTNSGTTKWAVGPYADPNNFIISASGSFGVYLNGTSAVSWTGVSDERLKDIIEPISNAVAKVGQLRSVIGKFKSDETNTRRSFLLAQDVQAVLPEAVDASNPDRLGVAYTDVIPLLVAAIKELTARVQTLEVR